MKYFINTLRVLVGLLFIFSGLVKLNDPLGFSYKMDEYFTVFSADLEPKQDSIYITLTQGSDEVTHSIILNQSSKNETISTQFGEMMAEGENELRSIVGIGIRGQEIYSNDIVLKDTLSTLQLPISLVIRNNEGKEIKSSVIEKYRENETETINIPVETYLKPLGFWSNLFQHLRKYALLIGVFVCILEVVMGLGLLMGWQKNMILWSMLLLIIFFTFLTYYSATYNKVTDCGCFGDAIPLTPWESFYKDIILLISTLLLILGRKQIKPLFSVPFGWRAITTTSLLSGALAAYSLHYLPVKNYLKFAEGNNIKEMTKCPEGAPVDIYSNVFIYSKNGKDEKFTMEEMSGRNLSEEGYVFKDRLDVLVSKGCEPPIHDFRIMDETRSNDYVTSFFDDDRWKLLVVMHDLDKSDEQSISELKEISQEFTKKGHNVFFITASDPEKAKSFSAKHDLSCIWYFGDDTNLRSIVRSNPGVLLFDSAVVKKVWPSTRLPKAQKLMKLIE